MKAAFIGVLAVLAACSPFGGASIFNCDQDSQCSPGGTCRMPDRLCTFPSANCGPNGAYGQHSGSLSGMCVDQRMIDAPDEPRPEAGDVCYGDGLVKPCFSVAPMGAVTLTGNIDTNVGAPMCATNVSNSGGTCVIAAASISVPGIVTASGTRPLLLVATGTITIAGGGALDVSSDRSPTAGGNLHFNTNRIGPASHPAACIAGTAPTASGGGAGGSFGTQGGTGGNGPDGDGAGTPGATQAATTIRGGCDGQPGNNGTPGFAGHGGGAVYLIANTVTIMGSINASGEGGDPGITDTAGAGGAGSGGMIVLDAPTIMNGGSVFANGGGGGEGSGDATRGNPGGDPTSIAAAPGGAGNSGRGGDGGAGATQVAAPGNGNPGQTMMGTSGGGGGGGGGVGVIKVFRGTLTGNASPSPS